MGKVMVHNKMITAYEMCLLKNRRILKYAEDKKQPLKHDLAYERDIIDSMIKGYPIGSIIAYERAGVYMVVDGISRIESIYRYMTDKFVLTGKEDAYKGMHFSELDVIRQRQIQDYEIPFSIMLELKEKELKRLAEKYRQYKNSREDN